MHKTGFLYTYTLHTMDRLKLGTWKHKYVMVGLLAAVGPASPQFPMQMFQMPRMMMAPPPASSPATSTEPPTPASQPDSNRQVAFAVPVPMPMPLQVAVPALPPPSFCSGKPCPPCPPCLCAPACTPSFFSYCSPCHKKCRCTNGKEPPEPLPPVPPLPAPGPAFALPMPMQQQAIMVPMPPFPRITQARDSCSSESRSSGCSSSSAYSDSSDCDDDGYKKRSKRGRRKHRRKTSRRSMNVAGRADDDRYMIKPVISFMDSSGQVKLKRALTAADVRALTADSLEEQNRRYLAEWLHTQTKQKRSTTTEETTVKKHKRIADEDNLNAPQVLILRDYKPKKKIKEKKHEKHRSSKLVSKPSPR